MSILSKQNIFAKIIFCLYFFYPLISLNKISISLVLIFLLLKPSLYKNWFIIAIKFLPLFSFYLGFALLQGKSGHQELILISKLSLILLLSIYLSKSTSIENFCSDLHFFGKKLLLPLLIIEFIDTILKNKKKFILNYRDFFNNNFFFQLEKKSIRNLKLCMPRKFSWTANSYIALFILTNSLLQNFSDLNNIFF